MRTVRGRLKFLAVLFVRRRFGIGKKPIVWRIRALSTILDYMHEKLGTVHIDQTRFVSDYIEYPHGVPHIDGLVYSKSAELYRP